MITNRDKLVNINNNYRMFSYKIDIAFLYTLKFYIFIFLDFLVIKLK